MHLLILTGNNNPVFFCKNMEISKRNAEVIYRDLLTNRNTERKNQYELRRIRQRSKPLSLHSLL